MTENTSEAFVKAATDFVGKLREVRMERRGAPENNPSLDQRFVQQIREYSRWTPDELDLISDIAEAKANIHLPDLGDDYLTLALGASLNTALYWWVSSGSLAEETKKRVRQSLEDGQQESAMDASIAVTASFMERLSKKNKEEKMYFDKYTPTIGLEIEYGVRLNDWKSKMGEMIESLPEPYKSRYRAFEQDGRHIISSKPMMVRDLFLSDGDSYFSGNHPYRDKAEIGTKDVQVNEMAFNPYSFVNIQLREFMYLLKTGAIGSERAGVQVNLGDIKVDGNHIEPMLLTALFSAAGYQAMPTEHVAQLKANGVLFPYETYKKTSKNEDGTFYVPFHKYGHTRDVGLKTESLEPLTELRFNVEYNKFSDLVRNVNSIFWLATALRAKQKIDDGEEVDETTRTLADVWVETEKQFELVAKRYGIDLALKESVSPIDTHWSEYREIGEEYRRALGKIVTEVVRHPEGSLRKDSRKIMIRARAKVQVILAEKDREGREGEVEKPSNASEDKEYSV